LLPVPVGVDQGTISRLRQDQPGSCGNAEYLAPCGPSMLNCIRCAYDTVRARLQTEVLSHR
jgi:hypothetical protein